ncbi:MAG TPA: alkaline phosphatase family protein [Planctomycetota bacterium]|nr:alkaline phosphatase family protein [Planctomycetota bacterium]
MNKFVPYDRVQVLALDSVGWDVLLPLVEDGTMPALASFLKTAHYGVLESTTPPHTAAAWTTWLTGKDPGQHGVIDFVRFDPTAHRFRFHDSTVQRNSSILTLLSNAGISCGSIFLPRNYPPYPLHEGYIVSGFETPSVESNFTEPYELREEILSDAPALHFNFEDDWEKDVDDAAFSRNIDRAIGSVELLERLAVHFQRTRPTRVQVAYLQATDILFHKAWKWCDAKTGASNLRRRELIKKFFRRVDSSINRILGLHSSESRRMTAINPLARTLRLICSDHGHGSSDGRIFVNNLLKEWGYLKPLGGLNKLTQRIASFSFQKEVRKTRNKELSLDWSRTRAYMAHVGINGFVYLNLKGREPHGIVSPDEFESVRDGLIEKFRAVKIPNTNKPLFDRVLKGEEIYARKDELNLPDIVLCATGGFFPRNKLSHKSPIQVSPNAVGGVHRPDGIYAISGPGIARSGPVGRRASIADICPTLLAALGQPIPADVTGKPMQYIFENPPPLQSTAAAQPTEPGPDAPVYTSEEQKAVEKRLADLGYLE